MKINFANFKESTYTGIAGLVHYTINRDEVTCILNIFLQDTNTIVSNGCNHKIFLRSKRFINVADFLYN